MNELVYYEQLADRLVRQIRSWLAGRDPAELRGDAFVKFEVLKSRLELVIDEGLALAELLDGATVN